MKINAKQTLVNYIDVEIEPQEVNKIVRSQTIETLVDVVYDKIVAEFLNDIHPTYEGRKAIVKNYSGDHDNAYSLILRDYDWDYHRNVGTDICLRKLDRYETDRWEAICSLKDHLLALYQSGKRGLVVINGEEGGRY